uniref:Integrase catalytic domain-containing protein n=1 Tax=Hemiselmis andersenii TaxID=464988 RepID=A0A7S0U1Z1_HEMAN|mmetsp:Transcript_32838/g.76487  ORF Transcript_32838/g.76487 Transcript_32838/m.76487 type:complete len:778 (+) Transcript_32838:2504-4837(+)
MRRLFKLADRTGRTMGMLDTISTDANDGSACDIDSAGNASAFLSRTDLLHLRYHAPFPKLQSLTKQLSGFPPLTHRDIHDHRCRFCDKANAHKQPSGHQSETVYATDQAGWACDQYDLGEDTRSLGGNCYVYVFVLLHSRFIHVELTPDRSSDSVVGAFNSAITQIGHSPAMLRTDKGREFESPAFQEQCSKLNVKHEFSNSYAQHQNGIAEAAVGKLTRYMRLHLVQSGLPYEFWGHAVMHAVDVVNHLPHCSIGDQIPIQRAGRKPFHEFIRPFGCQATIFLDKAQRAHNKLSPHGESGIYVGVGINSGHKGFRVYHPPTGSFEYSKNVTCDESFFPHRDFDQRYDPHHTTEFRPNATSRKATPTDLLNDFEPHLPGSDFTTHAGASGSAGASGLAGAPGSAGNASSPSFAAESAGVPVGMLPTSPARSARRRGMLRSAGAGSIPKKTVHFVPTNATLDAQQGSDPDSTGSIGRLHIDKVTDKDLYSFMHREQILFNISGDEWQGYEGKTFKCQIVGHDLRKAGSSKKQELHVKVVNVPADDQGTDLLETFWMPVSYTRRGGTDLRSVLKKNVPDMKCLWELCDIYPKHTPKLVKIKASPRTRGFFVRSKFSPQCFAVYTMLALQSFSATIGETPVLPSPEPKSYKDSLKRPDRDLWAKAEKTEMATLLDMGTFEIVDYDYKTMGPLLRNKWVYKLKCDEYGKPLKNKARLVIRGDMQSEDTFDDTFSPTSRNAAMRTVIALATELDYKLKHFDICAAFISANCDRDNIYVAAPD